MSPYGDVPDHPNQVASATTRASGPVRVSTSSVTGLRVVTVDIPVTSEDVRSWDDDE